MRLICPNCGAQYAVADGVIPSAGRDVQCSNCSHTWFETPGASSQDTPPAPRKVTPPKPAEPTASAADRFSGSIDDAFKNDLSDDVAPAPQPPVDRKPVDRSVADILREEAALEAAQRRNEAKAPIESQADLGLADPAPAPRTPPPAETTPDANPTPIASTSTAAAAAAAQASRRELLPDIEEINSSLRSDAERGTATEAEAVAAEKRKGFRRGFLLVLIIFALLVLVYIFAGDIATLVPALAQPLQTYVDTVDVWRIWLDDNMQSMLLSIAADTE